MSDRDALLAAILKYPAENTPRLMYADWLDEHGAAADRERAGFIRERFPDVPLSLRRRNGGVRRVDRYARDLVGVTVPKMYTRWLIPTPGSEGWRKYIGATWSGPYAWNQAIAYGPIRSDRPRLFLALRHGLLSALATTAHAFRFYAHRLFTTQPIESVALTDRWPEPVTANGRRAWLWANSRFNQQAGLPSDLWSALTRGELVREGRRYTTQSEAIADLAAVLLSFGRRSAGLPLLSPAIT